MRWRSLPLGKSHLLVLALLGREHGDHHIQVINIDPVAVVVSEGVLEEAIVIPCGKVLTVMGPPALLALECRSQDQLADYH